MIIYNICLVNKSCESFNINSLTPDEFKCLVLVTGLQDSSYSDIRARLLSKLKSETGNLKLENLITECNRVTNIKKDASLIEGGDSQNKSVKSIHPYNKQFKPKHNTQPRTPCWQCGDMHFVKNCSYTNHTCSICKQNGHKEEYCNCPKKTSSHVNSNTHLSKFSHKNQQTSTSNTYSDSTRCIIKSTKFP